MVTNFVIRDFLKWLEQRDALGYTEDEINILADEYVYGPGEEEEEPPASHYIVLDDGYQGVHKSVFCSCGASFYSRADCNEHIKYEVMMEERARKRL